jgi:hypothetical protein
MSRNAFTSSLLALLLCVSHVEAHALKADVRVGKDKITVESFFDDNTPAVQALVRVLDPNKKVVAEAKTNVDGYCALPLPPPGEYQLVVDAGAGHRTTMPITIVGADRTHDQTDPTEQTAARDSDTRVGDDSSRWLKIAIGLSAIAALSIGYILSRRFSSRAGAPEGWQSP